MQLREELLFKPTSGAASKPRWHPCQRRCSQREGSEPPARKRDQRASNGGRHVATANVFGMNRHEQTKHVFLVFLSLRSRSKPSYAEFMPPPNHTGFVQAHQFPPTNQKHATSVDCRLRISPGASARRYSVVKGKKRTEANVWVEARRDEANLGPTEAETSAPNHCIWNEI